MTLQPSIWILEDDPSLAFMYNDILAPRYPVRLFDNLADFKSLLTGEGGEKTHPPQLILADLRLGQESFLQFLMTDEISNLITCPFIVISGLDDLETLRNCFAEGANDFLTKPFQKNELLIKIERLLKLDPKTIETPPPTITNVALVFDPMTLSLRRGEGEPVFLTVKQVQIYTLLERAKGEPIPRKTLEREVWPGVTVSAKSLDVHLFNLRQKLSVLGLQITWNPTAGYSLHSNGG